MFCIIGIVGGYRSSPCQVFVLVRSHDKRVPADETMELMEALRLSACLSLAVAVASGFASPSQRCLRHLWLGPHKLMQKGVSAECLSHSEQGKGQGLLGQGKVCRMCLPRPD